MSENVMIGKLEFHLPEAQSEFTQALNGAKYACCIEAMYNWLRTTLKHGNLSDAEYDIYEKAQKVLIDTLDDYGITLEDISG